MKRIVFMLMALFIFIFSSNSVIFANPTSGKQATDEIIYGENTFTYEDSEGAAGGMQLSLPSSMTNTTYQGQSSFWNKMLTEYRDVVCLISSIATLTFILIFIVNFVKLGNTMGNPSGRSSVMKSLIVSGIATAGCGGVALITGVFYNMFI